MSKIGIKTLESAIAQIENAIFCTKCIIKEGNGSGEEYNEIVEWEKEVKDLEEDIKILKRRK